MKTHPLDRLLRSAANAGLPEAAAPAPHPVLEQRVLAAVRRARSEAEGVGLLAVLRWAGLQEAQPLDVAAQREAALITFLVTLSGLVIAGIGSAFWGVEAGALALAVQKFRRKTS